MGLDIAVVLVFLCFFSGGIWYIYGGYKYGFIDQKIMNSTLGGSWSSEDNYLYGKDAKRRGVILIILGLGFILIGLYFLYLHFILGVMKW